MISPLRHVMLYSYDVQKLFIKLNFDIRKNYQKLCVMDLKYTFKQTYINLKDVMSHRIQLKYYSQRSYV